jgi:hypothetical protein
VKKLQRPKEQRLQQRYKEVLEFGPEDDEASPMDIAERLQRLSEALLDLQRRMDRLLKSPY